MKRFTSLNIVRGTLDVSEEKAKDFYYGDTAG
jgi:hypothetical protein